MTRDFCTYFDSKYLPQGLQLYQSLCSNLPSVRLWVLCMDAPCYEVLSRLNLPGLLPVSLEDFETDDEALLTAKANRSVIEYYFTCTPTLLLYLFDRCAEVETLTYVDADLWFFSSPEPLYDEVGSGSIGIIEHRFPHHLRYMGIAGTFNVGWLTFRRDQNAFECLRWWRQKCLEWCYDRFEDGKFADQKYLDYWPDKFNGVVILNHKGANVAPWNLAKYKITARDGTLMVDEQPLVFFHFHGLKRRKKYAYDLNLAGYGVRPKRVVLERIYRPYIRALLATTESVNPFLAAPPSGAADRGLPGQGLPLTIRGRMRKTLKVARDLLRRRFVFVFGRKVL